MNNKRSVAAISRLAQGLAIAQIVLTIHVFIGFSTIGGADVGIGSPTLSCPNGVESNMTRELAIQCRHERLNMYLPVWVVSITQFAVSSALFCMAAGIIIWLVHKVRPQVYLPGWAFPLQAAAFSIMVIMHTAITYPWDILEIIRITVYGISYIYR